MIFQLRFHLAITGSVAIRIRSFQFLFNFCPLSTTSRTGFFWINLRISVISIVFRTGFCNFHKVLTPLLRMPELLFWNRCFLIFIYLRCWHNSYGHTCLRRSFSTSYPHSFLYVSSHFLLTFLVHSLFSLIFSEQKNDLLW